MIRKKKPNVNRRKHEIVQEKQEKSNQRKNLFITGLKILAYLLLAILIYPYLKGSSLFSKPTPAKPLIEITRYQEPEIEYNFYSLLPGEKVVEPPEAFSYKKHKDLSKVKSYMLQVGSFKTSKHAKKLQTILRKHKFKNITLDKIQAKKTTWYRVSLGPFVNVKSAKTTRANLTLKGIHNSVIKTRNIK